MCAAVLRTRSYAAAPDPAAAAVGVVVPWAGENQNTISAVFALALAFSEAARQSNTDAAKRLYPGGPFNPLARG